MTMTMGVPIPGTLELREGKGAHSWMRVLFESRLKRSDIKRGTKEKKRKKRIKRERDIKMNEWKEIITNKP
jgi:hypothetical protein